MSQLTQTSQIVLHTDQCPGTRWRFQGGSVYKQSSERRLDLREDEITTHEARACGQTSSMTNMIFIPLHISEHVVPLTRSIQAWQDERGESLEHVTFAAGSHEALQRIRDRVLEPLSHRQPGQGMLAPDAFTEQAM